MMCDDLVGTVFGTRKWCGFMGKGEARSTQEVCELLERFDRNECPTPGLCWPSCAAWVWSLALDGSGTGGAEDMRRRVADWRRARKRYRDATECPRGPR